VIGPVIGAVDPGDARRSARDILDGPRFRPRDPPKPLKGVLDWIGDRFRPVGEAIADAFGWLVEAVGPVLSVLLVGALLAGAVWALARGVQRRASRPPVETSPGLGSGTTDDPDALERDAAAAEARGDLELAVRLRFRAGLMRLDQDAHALTYTASIANTDVRRALQSREFDALADDFEQIAYAGEPAEAATADRARERWPHAIDDAREKARR
jgi:hypothetical protein